MRTLLKILFPFASIFLTVKSIELIEQLTSSSPIDYSYLEHLIIAILLVLYITGIPAFIGFAFPWSKLLSEAYYRIKRPELLRIVSTALGMSYFRRILLIYYNRRKPKLAFFDGTRSGIANFIHQTKQSEFGHLVAFAAITITSVILLFNNYYFLAVTVIVLNLIVNFYPIILQRLHRWRIENTNKDTKA